MVASSKGYVKGNRYNHVKMDGYYDCNDSMTDGLLAITGAKYPTYNFCWCNPNFEWEKY